MNNKNNKNGCGLGLLGTLVVIVALILYMILSSLICKGFIHTRFGDDAACAILTLSSTGMVVAFVLYEAIFVFWQIRLSQKANPDKFNSAENKKMGIIFRWVIIGCVSLSFVFAIFTANTFTELRPDSISKVCFVTTKEYRWDTRKDVLRYTFTCDESGNLAYKVTMRDGEVIEILGGVTSLSDTFKENYDTSHVNLLAYAADLSDEFDNSEYIIERKISEATIANAKNCYEGVEGKELIWEEIQRIIEK